MQGYTKPDDWLSLDAQYPEGEHEQGANKAEDQFNAEADDPEGEQQKPEDREDKNGDERQGPANDQ